MDGRVRRNDRTHAAFFISLKPHYGRLEETLLRFLILHLYGPPWHTVISVSFPAPAVSNGVEGAPDASLDVRLNARPAPSAPRSAPLPGRGARVVAALWRPAPRLRGRARSGGRPPGDGPAHPGRLHPALAVAGVRPAQCPDLRPLPLPAAAHGLAPAGARRRGDHHRQQVRDPLARQARVQSHKFRDCRPAPGDGPRLGLAGPVGKRRRLRLPDGLPGQPRRPPGRAQRRHLGLPRLLPGGPVRPRALAGAANGGPAPPDRERSLPSLHLLHDLGPQDHARLADRPRPLRPPRGPGCWLRPLRALPAQWADPVARLPVAPDTARRPAAARGALRLAPGSGSGARPSTPGGKENRVKRLILPLLVLTALAALAMATGTALAFCGFYVAKADTRLFNHASKVVLVRDEDRTVLTMANDFKGDPKEFAVVIPVPTVLKREQIHVAETALLDHLDAYSAPRLVEYYDENPCMLYEAMRMPSAQSMPGGVVGGTAGAARDRSLGVTIEATYTVGEYDILILSA